MANDSTKDEPSRFIDNSFFLPSPTATASDSTTFDVEDILKHRVRADGNFEYLVKWQGFSSSYNSWEPACNFLSSDMVREYHEKREMERLQKKEKRQGSVTSSDRDDASEIPFIPEKVLNIYQNGKGDLVTMVKFKNRPKALYVPSEWANVQCPQLVIEFFENRIYWTVDGTTLTKHNESKPVNVSE